LYAACRFYPLNDIGSETLTVKVDLRSDIIHGSAAAPKAAAAARRRIFVCGGGVAKTTGGAAGAA